MNNPSCKQCKYFEIEKSSNCYPTIAGGLCRLMPPTRNDKQPYVLLEDWCGQYKDK